MGGNIIIRIVLALSVSGGIVGSVRNFLRLPAQLYLNDNIVTDGQYDVETLVRDIFVDGGCENVSNIRAIGHEDGFGYFENGKASIGLAEGVILATGHIGNSKGPNNVTDASSFFEIRGNDRDLKRMATDQLYDPVGVEFDFIPLDSFVTFRYVFASEEYCEFVGSIYNDVFGFFISGPGIEGEFSQQAKNVALIPGTNDEVSINNINHRSNQSYFIQNYLREDARICQLDFQPSPLADAIEYDGFTQPMVASLKLIPCETYHIRMVISDVGDGFFDSAVFLEAGSFNIGGAVTVSDALVQGEALVEGCSQGGLRFEREDLETINYPVSVQFKLSPSSTAKENLDFEPLPRSITIPPGQTFIDVPIYAINDGIPEEQEYIMVELDIPCSCYQDSALVFIDDPPALSLHLPAAVVCKTGDSFLQPEVQGGTPPFDYVWENGSRQERRTISARDAGLYRLTVTDHCGEQAVDSSFLSIEPAPKAFLKGEAQICAGDTTYFEISFSGVPPWSFRYQRDDQFYEPLNNIYQNPYLLPVTQEGVYRLVDFNDGHCAGEIDGSGRLSVWDIAVEADIQPNACYDLQEGRISINIKGGTPPYEWKWRDGPQNVSEIAGLGAGLYELRVQDQKGCAKVFSFEVASPDPLTEVQFTCEDLQQSSLVLSARGGTPPYSYSTDGRQFMDESLFEQLIPGETYRLFIVDAQDCRLEQDFRMPIVYEKMVSLPSSMEVKLGGKEKILPQLNIPKDLISNIRWSPGEQLSCVNCLEPEVEAWEEITYIIHIIDIFGCSDEASVSLKVDRSLDLFIPTAFSPNGDGLNERFTIYGNPSQVKGIQIFQIYDRWGNLLFYAKDSAVNDETSGWDGYFRGKLMNAGVFIFHVELELQDGSSQRISGQFSLMR